MYDQPLPLFHKYGIEPEIEMMYSRHVPLPSGGSLVIDQTEAVVAIDVNSGRFPRSFRRGKLPPSRPTWKRPTRSRGSLSCVTLAA